VRHLPSLLIPLCILVCNAFPIPSASTAHAATGTTEESQSKAPNQRDALTLFNKADRELNFAWTALKKAIESSAPLEYRTLLQSQRSWAEYRDRLARSPLFMGPKNNAPWRMQVGLETGAIFRKDSAAYLATAADMNSERAEFLNRLVKHRESDTIDGVWSDGIGGRLLLMQEPGGMRFAFSVIRGEDNRPGTIAGKALWNKPIGWFSDSGRLPSKAAETSLSFVLDAFKIQVVGANTLFYHETPAAFDGAYYKTESLDDATRAELLKTSLPVK